MTSFPNERLIKILLCWALVGIASIFLFYNLGRHALWDDEAICTLFGRSVWQTGDTYALQGHNIIAFNYGTELDKLHMRYVPPFQFYFVAPFAGFSGESTLIPRLPFALCGLGVVLMMIAFLWRGKASIWTFTLFFLAIVGNVSLFLYARQARYYAPAILLSVILVYLYFYGKRQHMGTNIFISLLSVLLLAANYLNFIALFICFIVDYLIWGRRERPYEIKELLTIFIPLCILGGWIVSIHNPLGKEVWGPNEISSLKDKLILFSWFLRDFNRCEMGVGIFILITPFLYSLKRNHFLLRAPFIFFLYTFVIALLAPQPLSLSQVAFVRYLAPLIPLGIFISVLCIQTLQPRLKWLVVPVILFAFLTNVLHGGPLSGVDDRTTFSQVIAKGRFRSTVKEFIDEITNPPPSTRRAVADWIHANIREKESVWVQPGYEIYPLIYHAPHALYAWQIRAREGQFSDLPAIHFIKESLPDYMIAFGPYRAFVEGDIENLKQQNVAYIKIAQINQYWYDLTRAELFWHSFYEIKDFNLEDQAVYIYKRVDG